MALLANTPTQAEFLLQSLGQVAGGIIYQIALTALSSLTIFCHSLLLSGLLGCILCPHKYDASPCWLANTGMAMCMTSSENVTYELVFASPAVLSMSCSFYLNSLWDGRSYSCCFVGCYFKDLFKTARVTVLT